MRLHRDKCRAASDEQSSSTSGVSRRGFLAATAGLPLLAMLPSFADAAASVPRAAYPAGFLWGAATAGHQVEGNNVASDIWLLEQLKPSLFAEPSGDACDSLHRWGEDMDIVRDLGLNTYRFSIEWARIEPAEGQFSLAYLDHYKRMVEGCRERGLWPVVTYSHFTSPRWFAAKGGWENRDAPALFARFCERATRHLGAGIGHALTFNEPNLQYGGLWNPSPMSTTATDAIKAMLAAAAKASGSDRFSLQNGGDAPAMLPFILEGHRQGRAAIKSVRADLPVGLSLAIPDDQAVQGGEAMLARKRRMVYEPFFDAARDDDFIGVQTYGRSLVGPNGTLPAPKEAEKNQTGEEVYPAALGGAVAYAHAATGKPVLVTENGLATDDDAQRERYIAGALASLEAQMRKGVPVLGYLHWSLLDNFEWFSGYRPHFGLVAVDRQTFKRTVKPSAHAYARMVRERAVRG